MSDYWRKSNKAIPFGDAREQTQNINSTKPHGVENNACRQIDSWNFIAGGLKFCCTTIFILPACLARNLLRRLCFRQRNFAVPKRKVWDANITVTQNFGLRASPMTVYIMKDYSCLSKFKMVPMTNWKLQLSVEILLVLERHVVFMMHQIQLILWRKRIKHSRRDDLFERRHGYRLITISNTKYVGHWFIRNHSHRMVLDIGYGNKSLSLLR